MGTKGAATRRRILEAAWEASDQRATDVILAGLSVRDVAAAAGTSPSTVLYHFPTMRALALAMVDHLADTTSLLPLEVVEVMLDRAEPEGPIAIIQSAAAGNWDLLNTPDELVYERRLCRCYAATRTGPDAEAIRRRLDEVISGWIHDIAVVYELAAERAGLRLVDPFDFEDLARVLAGLTEGLLFQSLACSDAVGRDLVVGAVVALVSSVVAPAPQPVALAERALVLGSGRVGDEADTVSRLRDAVAVAHLFTDGWESVTLTRCAHALGHTPQEVAERHGTVRRLAATSFARHLPAVAEAVDRRAERGPAVSLADGVHELARAAVADRHCALALLHERQSAQMTPGVEDSGHDVRSLVPLGATLAAVVAGHAGLERATQAAELADLVVDTVLALGATRPRTPLNRITEMALRLVPAA
jgi:AcrR family transcriptional regulator